MSVPVVPRLLMAVLPAGRHEAVQKLRQVLLQPRLELDGPYRGGAAEVEDVGHAGPDLGARDDTRDLLGQVVHVAVAARRDAELLLKDHVAVPPEGAEEVVAGEAVAATNATDFAEVV